MPQRVDQGRGKNDIHGVEGEAGEDFGVETTQDLVDSVLSAAEEVSGSGDLPHGCMNLDKVHPWARYFDPM